MRVSEWAVHRSFGMAKDFRGYADAAMYVSPWLENERRLRVRPRALPGAFGEAPTEGIRYNAVLSYLAPASLI